MAAQMGLQIIAASIASGQSLSAQVDIGPYLLKGILLPSGWTAASLTFQVSFDGGATWFEHYSYAGSETVFGQAAGVGEYIALDPTLWGGVVSLKIRSGTQAAPVAQASLASLQLICRTN